MLSFSERLKAVVKDIDAAGSSLQARAIGQRDSTAQPQSPSTAAPPINTTIPRPSSPSSKLPLPSSSSPLQSQTITSPTRNGLAEGALSGLSGLRKSFNFPSRVSGEHTRTNSATQELKDISSPKIDRPHSPAKGGGTGQSHLGAEGSSSKVQTPAPEYGRVTSLLPPPNPDDPASYPLPPSPEVGPSLEVNTKGYADPLGASPLLPPAVDGDVPGLAIQDESVHLANGDDSNGHADSRRSREIVLEGTEVPRLSEEIKLDDEDEPVDLEDATRRWKDARTQYSSLKEERDRANRLLKELTPLEGGISDPEALEGWVRMMNGKVEMITEEMKRLQGKINLQDSRMEEVRDTHRLESTSQTELITKLRNQLSTAESNLASRAVELLQLSQLRTDLSKSQSQAKEEEEKRSKAISLLKTVRLKLVKVEKEKEEVERDRAEERAERSKAGDEVERVRGEKEREVNALRKGFERELAGVKERYEKDLQAKKGAWELEMITTKAGHAKEISSKTTKVNGLESIVKELSNTKQVQLEQLQSRQAEVETSRSEMEALQNRTKELEFQLRETVERCTLLEDSASRSRGRNAQHTNGDRSTPSPSPHRQSPKSHSASTSSPSSADVQRLLAEAESRAEAKLSDLRFKIRSLEKERNDLEEDWAGKLSERVREVERLKRVVLEKEGEYAEVLRTRREKEGVIEQGEEARRGLEREMKGLRAAVEEAKADVGVVADAERLAREEISSLQIQIQTLQSQLDESKNYSTQLKTNNRTLREELRKVQSSVQLMERQRNPGVGYWAGGASAGPSGRGSVISPEPTTPLKEGRNSLESVRTGTGSGVTSLVAGRESPAVSEAGTAKENKDEEEVNLEYLRNVILQFLEHKEMRPNLVRVLSVILRFTPQELRRLNAKLLT